MNNEFESMVDRIKYGLIASTFIESAKDNYESKMALDFINSLVKNGCPIDALYKTISEIAMGNKKDE